MGKDERGNNRIERETENKGEGAERRKQTLCSEGPYFHLIL